MNDQQTIMIGVAVVIGVALLIFLTKKTGNGNGGGDDRVGLESFTLT